jgi:hypothetical protein
MGRPMGRPTKRTPAAREKFLEALRTGASHAVAAEAAGLSRALVYNWRNDDPVFEKDWSEAEETGTDRLEQAILERAVKGTQKEVYQGGQLVGTVTEHHDTLAIFMMKARRPEKYKDRVHTELTGKDGGPIQHEVSALDELESRLSGIATRLPTDGHTQKPH